MNPYILRTVTDLSKPSKEIVWKAFASVGDANAHQFVVRVEDDGKLVNLSGATVELKAERQDHAVRYLAGTINSDGEATATLDRSCYEIAGSLCCTMTISRAGMVLSAAKAYLIIYGFGQAVVDPAHVVPSLEELLAQFDAAKAATSNANTAAKTANTAASNADAKADLANAAATNADNKATAAQKAADKANAAAQDWSNGTAANAQKLGGIPAASYLLKSSLRSLALSLAASGWTGSGPYTATIARSDVTAKTWVDIQLTAASLANYSAAINWETSAGKITLTTAVKPAGTLAGTLVLMEVI